MRVLVRLPPFSSVSRVIKFTKYSFKLRITSTQKFDHHIKINIKKGVLAASNHVWSLVISIMYPCIRSILDTFDHGHGFMIGT